eukprot:TRINITY_DN3944_c0_g1_i1.p2 TRINITY_DN3944_c0_g1~~TRINITY_DN3944_c0_g1_i1.p2  ORF type:complete len:187 (-),score=47.89 TRINITY_DN3944_c0_g1_i1:72-632(-)
MSGDERAAVVMYTQEGAEREHSLYFKLNAALRHRNRQAVKPWAEFVWLLMSALRKLPPAAAPVVFRGARGGPWVSGRYAEGSEFCWSAFSSTTAHIGIVQQFLGGSGLRVIFQLHLSPKEGDARALADFSLYRVEEEILLPPNVRFRVTSVLRMPGGLHQIQCTQLPSNDPIVRLAPSESNSHAPA